MLASAVGPNLTKLLHEQLDLMFACGLSEPLHQALVAIARYIPPLLRTIQGQSTTMEGKWGGRPLIIWHILDRLLDLLSTILSGQAYKPLGAPPLFKNDSGGVSLTRDVNTSEVRTNSKV